MMVAVSPPTGSVYVPVDIPIQVELHTPVDSTLFRWIHTGGTVVATHASIHPADIPGRAYFMGILGAGDFYELSLRSDDGTVLGILHLVPLS